MYKILAISLFLLVSCSNKEGSSPLPSSHENNLTQEQTPVPDLITYQTIKLDLGDELGLDTTKVTADQEVSFIEAYVGERVSQSVEIRNLNRTDLDLTSALDLSEINGNPRLSVLRDNCSGNLLAPFKRCIIEVMFEPTSLADSTSDFINLNGEPAFEFNLIPLSPEQETLRGDLSLSVSKIDFGLVGPGETRTDFIVIKNKSKKALDLSTLGLDSIAVSGLKEDGTPSDISVSIALAGSFSTQNYCPTLLDPYAACQVGVTYTAPSTVATNTSSSQNLTINNARVSLAAAQTADPPTTCGGAVTGDINIDFRAQGPEIDPTVRVRQGTGGILCVDTSFLPSYIQVRPSATTPCIDGNSYGRYRTCYLEVEETADSPGNEVFIFEVNGTAFTVTTGDASVPAPTVTISATPTLSDGLTPVRLVWDADAADSCTASSTPASDFSGAKATSGFQDLIVLETTTFTINCTGPGGTASDSVVVNASVPNPTVTISASPNPADGLSEVFVNWTSENTTECTASDDWSGTKGVNGDESVGTLVQTQTYTITCLGIDGVTEATDSVTVNIALAQPTLTISANPNPTDGISDVFITWDSENTTSCSAANGWSGVKALSGNESVGVITTETTFEMTCLGLDGIASVTQSVTVTINGANITLTATPNPANGVDENVTLNWNAQNIQSGSCTASDDKGNTLFTGTKTDTSSESVGVLTEETTFTLTCLGLDGITPLSESVTVTMNYPTPTITMSATPNPANGIDENVSLTWDAQNVTPGSCTASDSQSNTLFSGAKAEQGTNESVGILTSETTFTLSCVGLDGTTPTSQSVTVTITPPSAVITISATPNPANGVDDAVTVTWDAQNVTPGSCTASDDNGNAHFTGAKAEQGTNEAVASLITQETILTLTCLELDGTTPVSNSVTVTMNYPTPTGTLTANPTSADGVADISLTWTSDNATTCTASSDANAVGNSGFFDWTGTKATLGGTESVGVLNEDRTYTLTCTDLGDSNPVAVASVTVPYTPASGSIVLTSNQTNNTTDGTTATTISWNNTDVQNCSVADSWNPGDYTGADTGSFNAGILSVTTTYTLNCEQLNGDPISESITITYQAPASLSITLTTGGQTYSNSATISSLDTNYTIDWTASGVNSGSCYFYTKQYAGSTNPASAFSGFNGTKPGLSGSYSGISGQANNVSYEFVNGTEFQMRCTKPDSTFATASIRVNFTYPYILVLQKDFGNNISWRAKYDRIPNPENCVREGDWVEQTGNIFNTTLLPGGVVAYEDQGAGAFDESQYYKLTCTGVDGVSTHSRELTHFVNTPGSVTLNASTTEFTGSPIDLTWSSFNVYDGDCNGDWGGTNLDDSGTYQITNLASTTTFTITCLDATGVSRNDSVTITVPVPLMASEKTACDTLTLRNNPSELQNLFGIDTTNASSVKFEVAGNSIATYSSIPTAQVINEQSDVEDFVYIDGNGQIQFNRTDLPLGDSLYGFYTQYMDCDMDGIFSEPNDFDCIINHGIKEFIPVSRNGVLMLLNDGHLIGFGSNNLSYNGINMPYYTPNYVDCDGDGYSVSNGITAETAIDSSCLKNITKVYYSTPTRKVNFDFYFDPTIYLAVREDTGQMFWGNLFPLGFLNPSGAPNYNIQGLNYNDMSTVLATGQGFAFIKKNGDIIIKGMTNGVSNAQGFYLDTEVNVLNYKKAVSNGEAVAILTSDNKVVVLDFNDPLSTSRGGDPSQISCYGSGVDTSCLTNGDVVDILPVQAGGFVLRLSNNKYAYFGEATQTGFSLYNQSSVLYSLGFNVNLSTGVNNDYITRFVEVSSGNIFSWNATNFAVWNNGFITEIRGSLSKNLYIFADSNIKNVVDIISNQTIVHTQFNNKSASYPEILINYDDGTSARYRNDSGGADVLPQVSTSTSNFSVLNRDHTGNRIDSLILRDGVLELLDLYILDITYPAPASLQINEGRGCIIESCTTGSVSADGKSCI